MSLTKDMLSFLPYDSMIYNNKTWHMVIPQISTINICISGFLDLILFIAKFMDTLYYSIYEICFSVDLVIGAATP